MIYYLIFVMGITLKTIPALQVILYYDDVEICNPLGSRTKKHKLGMKYMYHFYIACSFFHLTFLVYSQHENIVILFHSILYSTLLLPVG